MVSFTAIVLGFAATAITGANAALCRYPYDNCGWVLASYGYTYDQLQAAAGTTDGSRIYDALYSCDSETGDISYLNWCGGGGKCGTGVTKNDNCTP
ncbi:hypothetical protein B0T18DRAFT_429879 [Schizothecium vesticola]|uniref:Uncharacterized protein n=1 Tax=Schizothecium vesticola TaxID=314040 RepID=A0AA40K5T6_9PEZI|nr:hypothetical protein B0T18DRAFT_429879 [Schizothecium vesticola]